MSFNPDIPFGTIISTDQTPKYFSIIENGRDENGNLQSTRLQAQLTYIAPSFKVSEGLGSFIALGNNRSLLFSTQDGTISTPFGNIFVSAGSALMLIENGGSMAVVNLNDDHQGAVSWQVGGNRIDVPVGRQLLLTNDSNAKFTRVDVSGLGYRDLEEIPLGDKKGFLSEISLPTALSMVGKSAGDDQFRRLQKTAAIMWLMGLGQRKEPFKASQ